MHIHLGHNFNGHWKFRYNSIQHSYLKAIYGATLAFKKINITYGVCKGTCHEYYINPNPFHLFIFFFFSLVDTFSTKLNIIVIQKLYTEFLQLAFKKRLLMCFESSTTRVHCNVKLFILVRNYLCNGSILNLTSSHWKIKHLKFIYWLILFAGYNCR